MAGSLAIVASEPLDNPPVAVNGNQWLVDFARFFTYPSLSSTHKSLVSLHTYNSSRQKQGTWLSTSSAAASLQIIKDQFTSDAILIICFRDKILEEHYVSKLNFSWPQVSCFSGFPARGCRVVIVSYKDSASKVQKFALRFSTICESEAFINALKDDPNDMDEVEFGSGLSSQSEIMSSNRLRARPCEDPSILSPVCAYIPQMPPSLNHRVDQSSCSQETRHNQSSKGISHSLPPSFTSLLTNCFSQNQQAQSSRTEEVDLKSQIAKYMEDSSFQDMLLKVEEIINEMEGVF
ncbi:protein POOR HOMOLOGOUS SYNAPSIS 1 [Carica papaya]|uniref:protein POOR HOMOLOGOUS SYNAPSIS 1 n=1 Tax=Carica papaya TaxID=3649 RepID=UPI000B8CA52E|nr:protein POOR HOMOLOGOUS SYNAPSIS 1 [Carica papaya]